MRARHYLLLLALCLAPARGAGDSSPRPPVPGAAAPGEPAEASHPLASAVERVAAAAAKAQRREAPRLDARLCQAAAALARVAPEEGLPPGSAIISDALALHGIVEPWPHQLIASYTPGQEQALLDGLAKPLGEALERGRFRRLGVGVAPLSESRARVLVLLLESFVEIAPLPRSAPLGQEPITVKGDLLPPYTKPQVLVTNPRGQVERVPGVMKGSRFEAALRCQQRGRYQIEVLGEDSHGSTVLAIFPLHCGQEAPRSLLVAKEAADPPFRDAREAEQQLLSLLNTDRARFGLPALQWDERLAAVARAHSADMRSGGFVGHVSPRTGNAGDRVRRAGIDTVALLENVAKAYSLREAQRGFMESPGHRANVLARDVTHGALGVELVEQPGGVRELWVTQLFMRPATPFDPAQAPAQALARIQELRRQAGLRELVQDAELGRLAAESVQAVAKGQLPADKVGEPVHQALTRFAGRYRLLRAVLVLTNDVTRMTSAPSLLDRKAGSIGVGVAPAPRKPDGKSPGMYVVAVLGEAK